MLWAALGFLWTRWKHRFQRKWWQTLTSRKLANLIILAFNKLTPCSKKLMFSIPRIVFMIVLVFSRHLFESLVHQNCASTNQNSSFTKFQPMRELHLESFTLTTPHNPTLCPLSSPLPPMIPPSPPTPATFLTRIRVLLVRVRIYVVGREGGERKGLGNCEGEGEGTE